MSTALNFPLVMQTFE